MEISEYLRKAIESELDTARADGLRQAIEALREWRAGIDEADFGDDRGYLDGIDDAITTLEGATR